MTGKLPIDKTETLTVRPPATTKRMGKSGGSRVQARSFASLGHIFVGAWAVAAALTTASQLNLAQLLERQIQTLFFELRGPVAPPPDIVILAMDEDSNVQGSQVYPSDPEKFSYLEPIQTSPPKRTAYAIAIDRLMRAGARTVSLDVVLDAPGAYPEADQQLQSVLKKYAGRITLAAQYADTDGETSREGDRTQLVEPNALFQTSPSSIGFINFPIAPDGRFHELGSELPKQIAETYPPDLATEFLRLSAQTPSFAEATLKAGRLQYSPPQGKGIFFYGPPGTFKQVPFWHVLDPTNWNTHRQQGTFKNKIVLIGPTAQSYQDFHAAPFSKSFLYPHPLTGIEIHANSIATLLQNRATADALPLTSIQGVVVLVIVAAAGYLQSRPTRSLFRLARAMSAALAWGGVCYLVFVYTRLILPSAVPMAAIVMTGVSYLVTGSASEYLRKLQLRRTLEHYAASPIVQEIINQQDDLDLRELLQEREQALFGKVLQNRYKIIKVLGSGGFGETYIAEDTLRPGHPYCVVKQLRPASNSLKLLQLARRLFQREAVTLERLGKHDQIPQLLAFFEEDEEFYLVQQYIAGEPLSSEFSVGKQLPEATVIALLQELLKILEFVHSQGVIHRDIKPSNIIRRKFDGKPVLIDFGAVKEIHQIADEQEQTGITVGIGTQGYMPPEQCAGSPRFNSDIYAIGMTGIQALTGMPPSHLKEDPRTGDVLWRHRAQVSHALTEVLSTMVRHDFTKRYQSAAEALSALQALVSDELPALPEVDALGPMPILDDADTAVAEYQEQLIGDDPETATASTQPWPETFGSASTTPAVSDDCNPDSTALG